MAWFKREKQKIAPVEKKGVPDGLWVKCPTCSEFLYKPELDYIEKTYPENPFNEEYLLAMKIYQITYDGFKEAYKSGEDFRNN